MPNGAASEDAGSLTRDLLKLINYCSQSGNLNQFFEGSKRQVWLRTKHNLTHLLARTFKEAIGIRQGATMLKTKIDAILFWRNKAEISPVIY
jgi:hypothetical protein